MRKALLPILLILAVSGPAAAGPLEDGFAAYRNNDYVTALRLWRPLAEQGVAVVQFNLSLMYNNGVGVPQDYAEAVRWFQLAAAQGHAFAQNNLGVMYYHGKGVPQDFVLAHMWFNIAAARGNEKAVENRDLAEGLMTREQVAEAQRLAADWRPKKS